MRAFVDRELGSEGFSFVLRSGREGTVHVEQVLEYNRDPGHLRDQLLYALTLEAQKRVKASALSRRELIRRLGTHMPRNATAAPGQDCPGIRIHVIDIVQPPGIAISPIAQPLLYSSWRRHQMPVSLRPLGARSSHWYMPQRPSSPRA